MTTYTVDTDGTSGDYSNLNAALADLPSPLDDDYTIECSASTNVEDTTAVSASPSLSTYDLTIKRVDDAYKLSVANSVVFSLDPSGTGDVTIQDMAIESSGVNAHYQHVVKLEYSDSSRGDYYLLRNTLRGADNDSYAQAVLSYAEYWGGTVYVVNNLIVDAGQRSTSDGATFNPGNTSTVYAYNNTIANCHHGIEAVGSNVNILAINNLVYGCDSPFEGGYFDENCDYNSTDSATATGGANDRTEQTFSFVDTSDYRLASDDTGALNHGTDLSSDANYAFDDDIDGDTRSGTWDIGADEYVGGGGTTTIPVMMHHYAMLRGR